MKKTVELKRKIAINLTVLTLLSAIFVLIIYYIFDSKNISEQKTRNINANNLALRTQLSELNSKVIDIKKYREIWKNIDNNKRNDKGIKMDDINSHMASIAQAHSIINPLFQASLPTNLENNPFNLLSINLLQTTGNLSFSAVDDLRANMFMSDFFSKLPGYIIITELDMRRIKKYSSSDYMAISAGTSISGVDVKVIFAWYVYKKK